MSKGRTRLRIKINRSFDLDAAQVLALTLEAERRYPGVRQQSALMILIMLEDVVEEFIGEECAKQRCRVCGCTHFDPCPEGCEWIEADLCSACKGKEAAHG